MPTHWAPLERGHDWIRMGRAGEWQMWTHLIHYLVRMVYNVLFLLNVLIYQVIWHSLWNAITRYHSQTDTLSEGKSVTTNFPPPWSDMYFLTLIISLSMTEGWTVDKRWSRNNDMLIQFAERSRGHKLFFYQSIKSTALTESEQWARAIPDSVRSFADSDRVHTANCACYLTSEPVF